jgi:hypothetical protein
MERGITPNSTIETVTVLKGARCRVDTDYDALRLWRLNPVRPNRIAGSQEWLISWWTNAASSRVLAIVMKHLVQIESNDPSQFRLCG